MTAGDFAIRLLVVFVLESAIELGGVILREGLSVRGLNTAASLWCAAAVSCLSAAGLFPQALMGSTAVLAANILLRPLGYLIINQQPMDETRIRTVLLQAISSNPAKIWKIESE